MSVVIRLTRGGAKKRPYYRIVVTDSRSPRDSKFIEKIGTFNPLLAKDSPERVKLEAERIQYWLSKGAKPSDRVASFLFAAGLIKAKPSVAHKPQKPRKKADKMTRAEKRAQAAAEAAAAPAAEASAETAA